MPANLKLATAKASPSLRALIKRYAQPFRGRLWVFSTHTPRHRDLLTSFPAATLAIVTRPPGDLVRTEAMRRVEGGVPLISLARLLELPQWYRRLPPEAFCGPPPRTPSGRGEDCQFGGQIINYLPTAQAALANWFAAVCEARAGGDDFALWVGAQPVSRTPQPARLPILPLTLYAWFSKHPELEAGQLIAAAWKPNMGFGRAAHEARLWLLGVLQERCAGPPAAWARGALTWPAEGCEIVPLTTPADLVAEGRAMGNCLGQYIGVVAAGQSRIFSLRSEGRRIAALEIRAVAESGEPILRQICGPRNAAPPDDVIIAAHAWTVLEREMLKQMLTPETCRHDAAAFERLIWRPFAGQHGSGADGTAPAIAEVLRDVNALGAYVK